MYRVSERLYWNADRTRLVSHGDPAGAFLAFPVGEELSDEQARRVGLLAPLAPPEPKQQRVEPANKLGARPIDKAAGKAAVKEITP